jgi:hypothetical protein
MPKYFSKARYSFDSRQMQHYHAEPFDRISDVFQLPLKNNCGNLFTAQGSRVTMVS